MKKRPKNYDYIKSLSMENLAQLFCDLMEETESEYGCDICPKRENCKYGKSGFLSWLEDDYE